MKPEIVAGDHVRFEGSYRITGPLRAALRAGWPAAQQHYDIGYSSNTLEYFLTDLLEAAQGPFGELLVALADAALARFNLMEDIGEDDDTFVDWWEVPELTEPVLQAMERALAIMVSIRQGEEVA